MAVNAQLLMSDPTPIAQGIQSLGQGVSGMMGQKRQMDINELAGQALMGEPGAMEQLSQQAPEQAMVVQKRRSEQQERARQRKLQRQELLRKEMEAIAPSVASAQSLEDADAIVRSELASGAFPNLQESVLEDGQLDAEEFQMFRDIAMNAGDSRYGLNLKTAMVDGERKFVQPSTGGKGYRVIEGIEPERDLAEQKFEREERQRAQERQSTKIDLETDATRFAELLGSPKAQEALGLEGAVKGTIGRVTGSETGQVAAGIDRMSSRMILGAAQQLSGEMSEGDIKLLERLKPTKFDAAPVWEDWYQNDFLPRVRAKAEKAGVELNLPETVTVGGQQQGGGQGGEDPEIDALLDKYGD